MASESQLVCVFAMAQHYSSWPMAQIQTRSSIRISAGVQPVNAIRHKFEKTRGHIGKVKNLKEELEDDSFAELPMALALPGMASFIGAPVRSKSVSLNWNTPLVELRNRTASVRAALDAAIPKPPIVSCDFQGRELVLAEEAAIVYEPTGRDIMNVLRQIARIVVVKDDCRVAVKGVLHPVYAHL